MFQTSDYLFSLAFGLPAMHAQWWKFQLTSIWCLEYVCTPELHS